MKIERDRVVIEQMGKVLDQQDKKTTKTREKAANVKCFKLAR